MSRRKKVPLLGSLALMMLLLAFGCSLLAREDGGAVAGWYIKLQVQAPGSKGITITDFSVTGLNIQVRDPVGELLQSIDWAAAEGPQSYMVPVSQMGQYQLEVAHFGERDGEHVQASESAAFNIQAMKITVIDIVPGCIGVIRVSPGQTVEPQPGTITGRLIGASTHDGYEFHVPVIPAGAEVAPDNLLGVWSGLIANGTAEALVRQPPEFVDPLLFGAGQLCDVYGFIDLDGDEVPSKNDWWAGPKTIRVDGDMFVDFTYPNDFEQLVYGIPSIWQPWGTWANEEYNGMEGPAAKVVIQEDGVLQLFRKTYDPDPFETIQGEITGDWTDAQAHWFQLYAEGPTYVLFRLFDEGNTFTNRSSATGYPIPSDFGPTFEDYFVIYYRQQ
jgi:hypothetical protein